jgi:hypothetical protein
MQELLALLDEKCTCNFVQITFDLPYSMVDEHISR